jgi:cobalt-zinc-cadmium efflux system outer membrane protein
MSTARVLPLVAALLAVLPACGPSRPTDTAAATAPAHAAAAAVPAPAPPAAPPPVETIAPGSALTIPQLLALAQRHNPTRAVFDANRRAAAAHVTQARAWDNPETEIDLGRARTTEGDHLTIGGVSIRQRIPWPGKRSARINAAQAEHEVTESETRSLQLDLAGEVMATALDLALDQQALDQSQAGLTNARQILGIVEKRLSAGEATKADLLRARVDVLQAEQSSAALVSDLAAARASLNALCGGVLPEGITIQVALDHLPATEREQAVATAQAKHPEFQRLLALLRQRQSEVARERSAAYPDLTIGVTGAKDTDSRSLGVSLGIDVPLWNQNQGGIESARAEVDRAQAELAVQRAKVLREVDAAWRAYDQARTQTQRYTREIRPAAQDALRLALSSYQAGESSLLDLLDARRTAQGVESAVLDAVRQVHAARVRLDLVTGSIADTLAGTTP